MTTEQDFLRAILDEPHDDTHRVVYADWLTDRDEPGDAERAEFIRAQCELAKLKPADDPACHGGADHGMYLRFIKADCRWCDLEYRQRCLFGEHGDGWFADLNARFDNDVCLSCMPLDDSEADNYRACVEVRRGFPATIYCYAQAWKDHGPALVAAHPIESVRLTDARTVRAEHSGFLYLRPPAGLLIPVMKARKPTRDEVELLRRASEDCLAWARMEAADAR